MAARTVGSATTTVVDFFQEQESFLRVANEESEEGLGRQTCLQSIQKLISLIRQFQGYDDYVSWSIRYWGLEFFPTDLESFKEFIVASTTPEGVEFLAGKVHELKTRILVTPFQVPFKGRPRLQGLWTLNEDELATSKRLFPDLCPFDGQPYEAAQRVHEFVLEMFAWIRELPPEIQDLQIDEEPELAAESLPWGPLHVARYVEYMNQSEKALEGPRLRRVDSDPRLVQKNFDVSRQRNKERKRFGEIVRQAMDYMAEEENRWDVQEFALACTQMKHENEQKRQLILQEFREDQEQSKREVQNELQTVHQKAKENQAVSEARIAQTNQRCGYLEQRVTQAEQVIGDLSVTCGALRQENAGLRSAVHEARQAANRRPTIRICTIS